MAEHTLRLHPQAITAGQRLTLLIVAVTGHGIKHLFNAAFYVLLPEIKAGLGLSNTQVGTLATFRNVVGGLANLPAGFVADRFKQRRALILGLSIMFTGAFYMLLGAAGSYWVAVAAAVMITVSINFWHPSAIASLASNFTTRRGFAVGLHGTGGSIGETIGPILAGALISALGWRVFGQGVVIPALISGIVIWLLLRTVPSDRDSMASVRTYLGSVGKLFQDRRLLLLLAVTAGFSGGQSTLMTFLPIYLREGLGYSSFGVGVYLALAQVSGIGAQPLMGYLSDLVGRKAVLVPGLAILGLAYLALSVAPTGWPLVLVVLIMGAFLFALMSILLAAALDIVGSDVQATTVSLVFGSAVLAAGFSPAVAGLLADAYGVKAAFVWAGGLMLTVTVVAAVSGWNRRGDAQRTAGLPVTK